MLTSPGSQSIIYVITLALPRELCKGRRKRSSEKQSSAEAQINIDQSNLPNPLLNPQKDRHYLELPPTSTIPKSLLTAQGTGQQEPQHFPKSPLPTHPGRTWILGSALVLRITFYSAPWCRATRLPAPPQPPSLITFCRTPPPPTPLQVCFYPPNISQVSTER